MSHVIVLSHGEGIPLGLAAGALAKAGLDASEVRLHRGEPLPRLQGHLAVIALGGMMGAYDEDRYPWLVAEKDFLGEAVAANLSVLGICLGCQLLADALGGSAYRATDGPEIGMLDVGLTAAGEVDPILRHLDGPVPVWHHDTWDLPPSAVLLGATDRFPQAFRLGSALGIQPHVEAGREIIGGWVESEGRSSLDVAGIDPEDFLAEIAANEPRQRRIAAELFGAWAGAAAQRRGP